MTAAVEVLSVISGAMVTNAAVVTSRQQCFSVNEALFREVASWLGHVIIGSTLAAIIISEHFAVCIFLSDTSVNPRRRGELYRLTKKHTLEAEEDIEEAGGILTRAVGSAKTPVLKLQVRTIKPSDTPLACSDGIKKVLSHHELNGFLAEPIEGLAVGVLARTIAQGATDDVSPIVFHLDGAGP
ncbi:PP2C family protein-serine/threonine phosphatase [Bradyrhizobium sp. USDA 10063]